MKGVEGANLLLLQATPTPLLRMQYHPTPGATIMPTEEGTTREVVIIPSVVVLALVVPTPNGETSLTVGAKVVTKATRGIATTGEMPKLMTIPTVRRHYSMPYVNLPTSKFPAYIWSKIHSLSLNSI
jgi:hypothetical protein